MTTGCTKSQIRKLQAVQAKGSKNARFNGRLLIA